jgi:hypothetical protein
LSSLNILERPPQFQWDSDSTCQNSNCRCTSEAMIAGFYKDTHISPNSMRSEMGYYSCGGTVAPQGVVGLESFGIPASWGQLTKDQVILKLSQNIPIDIAVVYGKIPRDSKYIQDMNFYGLHSVVACKRALVDGTLGLFIRDPDRWGTGKIDHVFWPDSVWIPAFAAANYVAVWPNNVKPDKTDVPPVVIYPYGSIQETKHYTVGSKDGLNQRTVPNITGAIEELRPYGYILASYLRTDKGGAYKTASGTTSNSWIATRGTDGKYHWFALDYLKAVI